MNTSDDSTVTSNTTGMTQQSSDRALHILFVVPYIPNLIRVRPYNLIRSLHRDGHQITLLTFYSNDRERLDADLLSNYCAQVITFPLPRWRSFWNCLVAVPGNTPLQAVYSWQPAGAGELDTLLRKDRSPFDVVHVEHLRGVRYALRALRTAPQNVPIVWDSVDCISLLFRQASRESNSLAGRLMTRLELGRTETYEGLVSSQFARVLVTSAKDRAALARLRANIDTGYRGMVPADDSRLEVLPNGVDLSYFQPIPFEDRVDNSLIVSGKMSYHANVSMVLHLVNEIMPRIWAQRPEVRLVIVGKDPVREIVTLAEHPKITVMGFVPDIRPFIQKAAIAVAPLVYGVGIQNKVLESLACGVPTITTSQAADALAAERHRHLLVADDPDTFAAETLHLLASPVRRFDLGQAGRAYVEEHHDWNVIARRLAGIYRAALSSKLVSQGVNIHPRGDKSKS